MVVHINLFKIGQFSLHCLFLLFVSDEHVAHDYEDDEVAADPD